MTRVFARCELATVLADARSRPSDRYIPREPDHRAARCCRGRRVSEIGLLRLDDVNVDCARRDIRARCEDDEGQESAVRHTSVGRGDAHGSSGMAGRADAARRPRLRSIRV